MEGTLLHKLVPNQITILCIGFLVTFLVFGDFRRRFSVRNLSLLLLLLPSFLLVKLIKLWLEGRVEPFFVAIFLLTAVYTAWGWLLTKKTPTEKWAPNLGERFLGFLVCGILILDIIVAFGKYPEDSGNYTNLGARRWMETGVIPYSDRALRGPHAPAIGAAATYGPVLYLAHMPFQIMLGAHDNSPRLKPKNAAYVRPPYRATQLACFSFFVAAVFALYKIMKRQAGTPTALGAVALFAASPYILGMGERSSLSITGFQHISHIAPTALVLCAFLLLDASFLSGTLLAAAAGALYFPAFLFPAWFGWLFHSGKNPWRFAAGFILTGLLLTILVLSSMGKFDLQTKIDLFIKSTLEHQEGRTKSEYGSSTFGFWGTHPRLAAFWQKPIAGGTSLFKPIFLLFATYALGAFFLARNRTKPQLAGLTASIIAALQLWKTHAGGTYVEWFYPFFLIALFSDQTQQLENPAS